ncbi:MAG: DAK2 domain-containing protein [Oscillospiraceae bacterium]|nr:DAK2 domain-containing protein [Oscillospiraceae bacterium]
MLTGKILKDAFISASNNIQNHRKDVDELNVFPVPDGDTGTNMSMTMSCAARELEALDSDSIADVSKTIASALLRGARGNSGVILSLLFKGISKGFAGKSAADGSETAKAFMLGVDAAYQAVSKPTEGTILTVARVSSENALKNSATESDEVKIFCNMLEDAKATLKTTPDLLPVLKKAGVVDSGGAGYVFVLEGMLSVIKDGEIIQAGGEKSESVVGAAAIDIYSDFTYCTEFIINKPENSDFDAVAFRAFIESIGDCAVVVEDDDVVKCHVHTNDPGEALTEALKNGYLSSIKIENMEEQNRKLKKERSAAEKAAEPGYVAPDPSVKYGFVVVTAGEGMKSMFTDLGADCIVSGGQTMNPSTDDILKAIHSIPATTVIVLPNNKNIIMAAEQAVRLADRRVFVLPTRTVPQGVSALLAFDPESDAETNMLNMTKAFEAVSTGSITFAARDADFDGHKIKKGELIAIQNGKLEFIGRELLRSCIKLVKSMLKKDSSLVTLYSGIDVSKAEAAEIEKELRKHIPEEIDLVCMDGGQPVYYFIISVE